MKFSLEHIGLIDKADIELAQLTVICGENNTGKTYVTYAIYGFLRTWRRFLPRIVYNVTMRHRRETRYKFDLKELFSGKCNQYLQEISALYSDSLSQAFGANATSSSLKGGKVSVSMAEPDQFLSKEYSRVIKGGSSGKVIATLSKAKESNVLEVLMAEEDSPHFTMSGLIEFIAEAIGDIVFGPEVPDTFIASAERTGAAIFRKELDFARTRMFEALGTLKSKELLNPMGLAKRMEAGYAWPVQDNVDFVRQLEDIDKQTGPLAHAHPELIRAFEAIVGGSYRVPRDKGLYFQPRGSGKLSMTESSSSVRALLDIGFYLRCRAKPGDLLIIDEPELNLHPKNQRLFARLIAHLINLDVKVFITTHSDYLIKELNTLIILSQGNAHTRKMQTKHGYQDIELLAPSKVRLYMTCTESEVRTGKGKRSKINTLREAKIYPDQGIDVGTFDKNIEQMNAIQEELLFGEEK